MVRTGFRPAIVASIAACGLAALGPPAASASDETVTGRVESGPILLGSGVAWAESSRRTRIARVVVAARGRRQVLFSRRLPQSLDRTVLALSDLEASRHALAFSLTVGDPGLALLYGARRGHTPRLLRRCPEAFSVGVGGPLIATIDIGSGSCGTDGITVRNLLSGRSRRVRGPNAREDGGIEIAGRYLAFQSADERGIEPPPPDTDKTLHVVVYDRVRRRIAYRTPLGFERGVEFDLAADGTLVILEQKGNTAASRISYFTPAEPTPHVVNAPAVSRYGFSGEGIALAGGRVAHARRFAGGTEVVVTGLRSGRSRVVGRVRFTRRSGDQRVGGIAFDGRRVAWATRGFRHVMRNGRLVEGSYSAPVIHLRSVR